MPQVRNPDNVSYTFDLPKELRDKGRQKSELNNFPLSTLFRILYEEFVENPIESSMEIVRRHNSKKVGAANGKARKK